MHGPLDRPRAKPACYGDCCRSARLIRRRRPKLRLTVAIFRVCLCCLTALVVACSGAKISGEQLAVDADLQKQRLRGDPFQHLAYVGKASGHGGTALHVYLSGDGTPWIGRTRISADPTPRNPIALRLMALDPNPRLYLGRPCYEGFSESSGCGPYYWTAGRYSEPVVASMTSALRRYIDDNGFEEVVVIGYSGGGVLAWLLAERLAEIRGLVTIAANLDIAAWTSRHGYTPLEGSLNPAGRGPLPERVAQLHLVGSRDTNVPPSLVRSALRKTGMQAQVVAIASDHRCCWESHWPAVLEAVGRIETR